jgi:anti-sigma-K factor RskA
MTGTDIHALAGAYALDAVNDLERVAFDRHLAGCEACSFEVAELRTAAARLADSTWSAAPPRLRDNVLKQVSHTRQTRPGTAERFVAQDVATPGRWRRRLIAVAAVSLLTVGVGAGTFLVEEQRVHSATNQSALAAANQREMAQIRDVMAATDARLRQVPVKGGGRISVVYSAGQNAAVAMLAGLNQPAANRAYELWLVKDKQPAKAWVLAAGHNAGTALLTGIRDAQEIAITQEPAGGSPKPTQDPMAAVTL